MGSLVPLKWHGSGTTFLTTSRPECGQWHVHGTPTTTRLWWAAVSAWALGLTGHETPSGLRREQSGRPQFQCRCR